MTRHVVVRPLAERDLEQAQDWYEQQRVGLGADFRSVVDSLLGRLADTPFIYPVVHKSVRRAVLSRFPYLIYFVVDASTVTILACLHSGRDPRHHKARIR